jgi:hypothetical protein
MDEVIPLWSQPAWDGVMGALEQDYSGVEALFVPTIDLFHDVNNMKSMGQKWYVHLNLQYLERGPVVFARRPDGTIDITKSDTCELINSATFELAKTSYLVDPRLSDDMKLRMIREGQLPVVIHLGWLNKEQRLRQSEFWTPVWNARNGTEVEHSKTMEELNSIEYKPHGLPPWNQKYE